MPAPALPSPTDPATLAAILEAYRQGAFPMARSRRARTIDFYTADPRAIVPIEPGEAGAYAPSRSVRSAWNSGRFAIRSDTHFRSVITACANAKRTGESGTWINDWMIDAYSALHHAGHAHSVEAWAPAQPGREDRLVGGLYGVRIGGAFFGESMFHVPGAGSDASKVCLAALVQHLRARRFVLLDTQFINDHMRRQGAVEVPAGEYRERLARALGLERSWLPWAASAPAASKEQA